MKTLFINSCVRPESRTKMLAEYVLSHLEGEVVEVNLEQEGIMPLDLTMLNLRSELAQAGDFSHPMFDAAKKFASADAIVIAAPYWDLSFPASLKSFIEAINIVNLTFAYSTEGFPYSMCKAKRLIYVTTAGGPIISDAFGYGYIEALAKAFYGIDELYYFKAENLDVVGVDVEEVLAKTKKEIDTVFV